MFVYDCNKKEWIEKSDEVTEIKNQDINQYDSISYGELVSLFIRERYSLNEELAISRQRDTKPEEFNEYYTYCEECKARAREIIHQQL